MTSYIGEFDERNKRRYCMNPGANFPNLKLEFFIGFQRKVCFWKRKLTRQTMHDLSAPPGLEFIYVRAYN